MRLSAFQVLTEIFERSHKFRVRVVEELQEILALVLETDPMSRPLPPPKAAKQLLNNLALKKVDEWVKGFGASYPKLHHAYNFLRQVKRVSFNTLDAERTEAERRRREEKEEKLKLVWKQRTTTVRQEMTETMKLNGGEANVASEDDERSDFEDCMLQIQNCLELLLPSPENFLHDSANPEDKAQEDDEREGGREHGILDIRTGISVSVKSADLESDANNSALLENLRDQYLILTNKLIPLAKKWIVILTKAGNEDTRELLKSAIDLKVRLEQTEVKAKALGDEVLTRREKKPASSKQAKESDEDEEDDFEEVADKVDYEKSADDDKLLEMVFLRSEQDAGQPKPGTSKSQNAVAKKPLFLAEENDPSDPTTLAASWKKLTKDVSTSATPRSGN